MQLGTVFQLKQRENSRSAKINRYNDKCWHP